VVEQSVNLQKSQYSLRYYLNVELTFATEAGTGRVVGRAESLLSPAEASQLETLLDVDGTEMEEEHREHQLVAVTDTRPSQCSALTFVSGARSLSGAAESGFAWRDLGRVVRGDGV
jgi:hypothetical protein